MMDEGGGGGRSCNGCIHVPFCRCYESSEKNKNFDVSSTKNDINVILMDGRFNEPQDDCSFSMETLLDWADQLYRIDLFLQFLMLCSLIYRNVREGRTGEWGGW